MSGASQVTPFPFQKQRQCFVAVVWIWQVQLSCHGLCVLSFIPLLWGSPYHGIHSICWKRKGAWSAWFRKYRDHINLENSCWLPLHFHHLCPRELRFSVTCLCDTTLQTKHKRCSKTQITHPAFPWLFVSLWRDISSLPFYGTAAWAFWRAQAPAALTVSTVHARWSCHLQKIFDGGWRVLWQGYLFFSLLEILWSLLKKWAWKEILVLLMLLQSVMSPSDLIPPCLWRDGLKCLICQFQLLCASEVTFFSGTKIPLKQGFKRDINFAIIPLEFIFEM